MRAYKHTVCRLNTENLQKFKGQDPGVICLSLGPMALAYLGYPDQVLKRSNEAISLARKLNHPFSEANARFFLAQCLDFGGRWTG